MAGRDKSTLEPVSNIPTGVQARTVRVLVAGQILAGLGQGATL